MFNVERGLEVQLTDGDLLEALNAPQEGPLMFSARNPMPRYPALAFRGEDLGADIYFSISCYVTYESTVSSFFSMIETYREVSNIDVMRKVNDGFMRANPR